MTWPDIGKIAMPEKTTYPADIVTTLELQWGSGFLSPGGPEEVLEILSGVDVAGKRILDVGCGIAGPAIVIAQQLHPDQIIGIDIDFPLVEKGRTKVEECGLSGVIDLQTVNPGPLPFPDAEFDLVFSKDSLIHIEETGSFYGEILRVLKSGGVFVGSDWLVSSDAQTLEDFNIWRSLTGHAFNMQTSDEVHREISEAGFSDVTMRDRNEWYVELAMEEVRMMQGQWKGRFVAALGEENYQSKLDLRLANARAAQCGGLRPTHLKGVRSG
jgi:ubiquinone/menaquinone biosynthesis C-methylase UbiE